MSAATLPTGIRVLERGWLSSNNVLLVGKDSAALVDSGYWTHSEQTVQLVHRACEGRQLQVLINTHLHSDHCGGNAALQEHFPSVQTLIPPGLARAVRRWDEAALTYTPTGQACPRFRYDDVLAPGSTVRLADGEWEIHAAPGHDPHSVILYEPNSRTLISADALWENGFGVVFPELEGDSAFDEVAKTLDVIERLRPQVVIPGHGAVFCDVPGALVRARSRLDAYVRDPRRHATHAAKVLLKFKLLEWQQVERSALFAWTESTPYFALVHARVGSHSDLRAWIDQLLAELVKSGALGERAGVLFNA
jgi:glyoxylase-like metal-dependent hydrolase (beta-lactamase superfamily II)